MSESWCGPFNNYLTIPGRRSVRYLKTQKDPDALRLASDDKFSFIQNHPLMPLTGKCLYRIDAIDLGEGSVGDEYVAKLMPINVPPCLPVIP